MTLPGLEKISSVGNIIASASLQDCHERAQAGSVLIWLLNMIDIFFKVVEFGCTLSRGLLLMDIIFGPKMVLLTLNIYLPFLGNV